MNRSAGEVGAVAAAVFAGGHFGEVPEELVEVTYAPGSRTAGNVQHGEILGGEQACRPVHFGSCEVGYHRFSGVLPEIADDHGRGIAGQTVDVRGLTGDVLRGMDSAPHLAQPLRRAGGIVHALLAEKDQGVGQHLADNHVGKALSRSGFPEQIDFPGALLERGEIQILQRDPGRGAQKIRKSGAYGSAQLLQFLPGDGEIDVDAALAL